MSIVLRFHNWFIMTVYCKRQQILLQNATAILLQNATEVYCKMCQVFYYKIWYLLQNLTFITNKLRQYIHSSVIFITFFRVSTNLLSIQFVIFNPWKVPWNWIAFYQNSFVISPGLLYHLIRRNTGRLANEAITSNPIVSWKQ